MCLNTVTNGGFITSRNKVQNMYICVLHIFHLTLLSSPALFFAPQWPKQLLSNFPGWSFSVLVLSTETHSHLSIHKPYNPLPRNPQGLSTFYLWKTHFSSNISNLTTNTKQNPAIQLFQLTINKIVQRKRNASASTSCINLECHPSSTTGTQPSARESESQTPGELRVLQVTLSNPDWLRYRAAPGLARLRDNLKSAVMTTLSAFRPSCTRSSAPWPRVSLAPVAWWAKQPCHSVPVLDHRTSAALHQEKAVEQHHLRIETGLPTAAR